MPSAGGLTAGAMKVSMQCAIASMPVAAVRNGGRPSVSSGSQMAVLGTRCQLWKPSFRPSSTMTIAPRATSLPVPAVVGTAISGATRSLMRRAAAFDRRVGRERPGVGRGDGDALGEVDARAAADRDQAVAAVRCDRARRRRGRRARSGSTASRRTPRAAGRRARRRARSSRPAARTPASVTTSGLRDAGALELLRQQREGAEVELDLGDVVDECHALSLAHCGAPVRVRRRTAADHAMQRSDFRFFERLRVRWAEIDAQKIVFNGHYLMYFDTAVAGYWRALGDAVRGDDGALGGDLFVRKATLEYVGSARLRRRARHRHALRARRQLVDDASSPARSARTQLLVSGELIYVFADPGGQGAAAGAARAARRCSRASRPASRWSTCASARWRELEARRAADPRRGVRRRAEDPGRHGMGRRRCRRGPRRRLQPPRPRPRHRADARARARRRQDRPDGGRVERRGTAASAAPCSTRCSTRRGRAATARRCCTRSSARRRSTSAPASSAAGRSSTRPASPTSRCCACSERAGVRRRRSKASTWRAPSMSASSGAPRRRCAASIAASMPASTPARRARRQRIGFHPGRRLAVVASEQARLQAGPLAAQAIAAWRATAARASSARSRRTRYQTNSSRTAIAAAQAGVGDVERHGVGQRARRSARSVGAAEAQVGRPSAARRTSTSALPPRCSGCGAALATVPAGSPASPATKTSWPAVGSDVAVEEEGAPLDRAAVLAARDDLLPGVAALLEVDAADELEVDHLRHEAVDRRRLDRDDAALAPRASARSSSVSAGAAADVDLGAGRRGEQARAQPGGIGQADQPRRRRAVARCQTRGIAEHRRRGRRRRRRTARSRRSHRSACTWRAARTSTGASASARARSARAGEQELVVGRPPDDEARLQPALGRAEAGEARRRRGRGRRRRW